MISALVVCTVLSGPFDEDMPTPFSNNSVPEVLVLSGTIVATFVSWQVIHESSHLIASKQYTDVKSWRINLRPNFSNGKVSKIDMYYSHEIPRGQNGITFLAPKFADIGALSLLPTAALIENNLARKVTTIFLIGGGVDMVTNSIGINEQSDLKRAASELRINPWVLRAGGIAITTLSFVIYWLVWQNE